MPRKQDLQTLRSSCLAYMAIQIDWWCDNTRLKEVMSEYSNRVTVLAEVSEVVEFFHNLPLKLVLDLLAELKDTCVLKPMHLNLLLSKRLERLDLSRGARGSHSYNQRLFDDSVAALISDRCPNLTFLDLTSCANIQSAALERLVFGLPNIKVLNVGGTQATDTLLKGLRSHCPKLQELDVSHCRALTDAGIAALCDESQETERLNLCSLDIEGTDLTPTAILRALVSFPLLRVYRCNYLCDTFLQEFTKYKNTVPNAISTFDLTNLHVLIGESTGEIFKQLSYMFPRVTDMVVHFEKSVKKNQLEHLTKLKNLEILGNEDVSDDDELSYGDDMRILKKVGKQLIKFILMRSANINIDEIGKWCPNLEKLQISWPLQFVHRSSLAQASTVQPFMHLKKLDIECVCAHTYKYGTGITPSQFITLMVNSHNLKSIRLKKCYGLTDRVISTVLKNNSLSCLKFLSFTSCYKITYKSIMKFIDLDNPLAWIELVGCKQITRADNRLLTRMIQNQNLQLHILYEPKA